MAESSSPDYKSLYLAEKARRQAQEELLQEREERHQAREERHQAQEERLQANLEFLQAQTERYRFTTFLKALQYCHNLSQPLRAASAAKSTTGRIPVPKGKYCPIRLEHWSDCSTQLSELFASVCRYFGSETTHAGQRLFASAADLELIMRKVVSEPISCEKQIEAYERFGVEGQVHDIIAQLCTIPAARDEFSLGDGIEFSSHRNNLDETVEESEEMQSEAEASSTPNPRPDQYCIHRVDSETKTLLTSVEYKPPHKLSSATLAKGLRPMDLWKHLVRSNKIPTDDDALQQYNAERAACSAIVQEYHVMIQEGLEYSYITTGLARVLLYVPYNKPSTLCYFLCDPSRDVDAGSDDAIANLSKTSVARVLCLCLSAFRSSLRGQEWRHIARQKIPIWTTQFDDPKAGATQQSLNTEELQQGLNTELQQGLNAELQQGLNTEESQQIQQIPHSDDSDPKFKSPDSSSSYNPSSPLSPLPSTPSSPSKGRQLRRLPTTCKPQVDSSRPHSSPSSDSETDQASRHKRNFSQVSASSNAPRAGPRERDQQEDHSARHSARYCTQRCLLGLSRGSALDELCPNVSSHRRGEDEATHHSISCQDLMISLKAQMDENIDRCIPVGPCGGYGAPFKLTCTRYGYTVIGKGTNTWLWTRKVSREAQAYHVLRPAQASAVPVFLGTLDLAKTYFLHGAGEIRHMLVMGWGGKTMAEMVMTKQLKSEISKSWKEVLALGIVHDDYKLDNILWNEELGRALVIDFHGCTLRHRPSIKSAKASKRKRLHDDKKSSKRSKTSTLQSVSQC